MKKLYTYAEESDDLKLARQADAQAYREFLVEHTLESLRLRWVREPYTHWYDTKQEWAA